MKSIDLQVALPKAPEAGRVQQAQQQHALTRQAQFAEEMQQRVEREKKQVHQVQKTEVLKIREEDRRKGGPGRRGSDRRREAEKSEKDAEDGSGQGTGLGAVIDIKL